MALLGLGPGVANLLGSLGAYSSSLQFTVCNKAQSAKSAAVLISGCGIVTLWR